MHLAVIVLPHAEGHAKRDHVGDASFVDGKTISKDSRGPLARVLRVESEQLL